MCISICTMISSGIHYKCHTKKITLEGRNVIFLMYVAYKKYAFSLLHTCILRLRVVQAILLSFSREGLDTQFTGGPVYETVNSTYLQLHHLLQTQLQSGIQLDQHLFLAE